MTAPLTEALGATIKVKGQEDWRRPATLRDQHGRTWATQINKETLHPVIAMTPAGWRSPFATLTPAQKYLKVPQHEFGMVFVDYDQWIVDWSDAEREYRDHLLQVARKEFGAAAMRAIDERDPKLRLVAGPGPQSVEFVKAMKAGNKWALGIPRADGTPYPMPPWAEPLADSLRLIETYDGSNIAQDVTIDMYPDVDDDTGDDGPTIAARYGAAEAYADLEETVDPDAVHGEPMRRGRGRPRKPITAPLDDAMTPR